MGAFGSFIVQDVPPHIELPPLVDGAGPAVIGAILGSAVPLAWALTYPWRTPYLPALPCAPPAASRRCAYPALFAATGVVLAVSGAALPQ